MVFSICTETIKTRDRVFCLRCLHGLTAPFRFLLGACGYHQPLEAVQHCFTDLLLTNLLTITLSHSACPKRSGEAPRQKNSLLPVLSLSKELRQTLAELFSDAVQILDGCLRLPCEMRRLLSLWGGFMLFQNVVPIISVSVALPVFCQFFACLVIMRRTVPQVVIIIHSPMVYRAGAA